MRNPRTCLLRRMSLEMATAHRARLDPSTGLYALSGLGLGGGLIVSERVVHRSRTARRECPLVPRIGLSGRG